MLRKNIEIFYVFLFQRLFFIFLDVGGYCGDFNGINVFLIVDRIYGYEFSDCFRGNGIWLDYFCIGMGIIFGY